MSNDDVIRIDLIDDHKLNREGVKQILSYELTLEVVAEPDDGNDAQDIIEAYLPDIILMDINIPETNGIEATKQLLKNYSNVKVIILSIHDDESYVTH